MAQIAWTQGKQGTWLGGTNRWVGGTPPAAGDDVAIDGTGSVVALNSTLTAAQQPATLEIGSAARLNIGSTTAAITLNLSSSFDVSGTLALNGSTVPRLTRTAIVNIGANSTIEAGGTLVLGQSLGTTPNGITGAAGLALTNNGIIIKSNPASASGTQPSTIGVALEGSGTVLISAGTLNLNGGGIGEFDGGVTDSLAFLQSGSGKTTFVNLHGSQVLAFTTGFQSFSAASTIIGGLTVLENGGLLNRIEGTYDVYKTLIKAGELDINSADAKTKFLEISQTGAQLADLGGTGTLEAQTATFTRGQIGGLATQPNVTVTQTIKFIGNNLNFTVSQGSTLTSQKDAFFIGQNSTFTLNGTFDNAKGATFDADVRSGASSMAGAGMFENNGIVLKVHNGTYNFAHIEGGTIDVTAGNVAVNGGAQTLGVGTWDWNGAQYNRVGAPLQAPLALLQQYAALGVSPDGAILSSGSTATTPQEALALAPPH